MTKKKKAHENKEQEEALEGIAEEEEIIETKAGKEEVGEEGSSKDEIDALKKELFESEEKFLRKCAEIENFKKRMEREKQSSLNYANEELLKALLPSIDNLERALTHSTEESSVNSLKDGVELTLKELLSTLKKIGLEPVEAEGAPFDPNKHEALSHEDSDEHDDNIVIKELQKGYMYKERLIRPALVIVAKKSSDEKKEKEAVSGDEKTVH